MTVSKVKKVTSSWFNKSKPRDWGENGRHVFFQVLSLAVSFREGNLFGIIIFRQPVHIGSKIIILGS